MRPSHHPSSARLCFGTAQLGMPYGAANTHGMPSEAAAEALIKDALERGITLFDTAHAYGEAERRLGGVQGALAAHGATVMTKLALLDEDATEERVERAIAESLERLGLSRLAYVLLHRAAYLHEGRVWGRLKRLQAEGKIARLGVSVATPEELVMALGFSEVTCVQLPFHILDQRWKAAGIAALLMERRDVLVCVRSVFLQGVLTMDAGAWPLENAGAMADMLDGMVARFGRQGRADLCLAYVRGQEWIDVVVLGMETPAQLQQNVALFETEALKADECAAIEAQVPILPERFLNPALWPKKE